MRKIYSLLFIIFFIQITVTAQTSFPLEIGNKWYYQAGSTRYEWHYKLHGVTKEVIDTTDNGFREILVKEYYKDSISTRKEYWGYINKKFYIDIVPEVKDLNNNQFYNDSLKTDSCFFLSGPYYCCIRHIDSSLFGIPDIFQEHKVNYQIHGFSFMMWKKIISPNLGIVFESTQELKYRTWTDSIYLIGLFKNNELIGDSNFTIKGMSAEYHLSQNYPNPFNPTTTIQYQIPQAEFVKLKVYDLLGREVASLVNEEKLVGSYEVEFNGEGLSSGVYFCRLEAVGYMETKKLLLLK